MEIEVLVYSFYIKDSIDYLKRIGDVFLKYDIPAYRLHDRLRVGKLTFIAYCEANHTQVETGRRHSYTIGVYRGATDEEVEKHVRILLKQMQDDGLLGGKKLNGK